MRGHHLEPGRPRRRAVTSAGLGVVILAAVLAACSSGSPRSLGAAPHPGAPSRAPTATTARSEAPTPTTTAAPQATSFLPPVAAGAPSYLAPGSDPSVLPGPLLIADKLNNRLLIVDPQGHIRWSWPQPGDLAPGQTFQIPDDAFFSPDGHYIIATEEDDYVITVIDVRTGKIVWRYGHPGVSGSAPGYLWNPDDAMLLRDGQVIAADIKNCRIIQIPFPGTAPSWQEGTLGACAHRPPVEYGSPNGVFPLLDGHYLVTEINGDWVDEIDTAGHVYWETNPPGINYPSDSNQVGPDRYVTVDYSSPGQVLIFDQSGQALWRYAPTSGAPAELNHPSLAMGLPNGDILLNDDYDHRVVVIDPRTNQIVWQYGHDTIPGSAPGYLDNPDGLDLLPPYSYADRNQPG